MKRWIAALLLTVMLMAFAPAQADFGTLYMVVDCLSAPMYSGYSETTAVLRYVNVGEIVYCFAELEDWLCVIYGNHVGYIDKRNLAAVDDGYYEFFLPNGEDATYTGGNSYVEYVGTPYFTYAPQMASATQKLATRSGPGTDYTDTLTYPQNTQIQAYYLTGGSGVDWVYIGFTYRGESYLLYTGAKRVNAGSVVPANRSEEGFEAYITKELTPYYGPGYNYASAKKTVPAGSIVTGFYQSVDGWLMFDYQIPGGKIQRAWAPYDYWR